MMDADTPLPWLSEDAADADFHEVAETYRALMLMTLEAIVSRFERDPDYGFIDTKLDIARGEDFPENDPVRGRNAVYGWIQGRGLEALAGHLTWLARTAPDAHSRGLHERTALMLHRVGAHLERIRHANGGRLYFMMDRSGRPMSLDARGAVTPIKPDDAPTSASTTTDLFYAKGLVAAGAAVGERAWLEAGIDLMQRIESDLSAGRFRSDQQSLDPRNPAARRTPGRRGQGAHMLAVGACTVLFQHTGKVDWAQFGVRHIEHVLSSHVRGPSGRGAGESGAMWEFVNDAGEPWLEDGKLHSDPGHATEFAGLALRHLRVCRAADVVLPNVDTLRTRLVEMLRCNFANGFRDGRGIVKGFDLISGRTVNGEMPWWSLPETMRAACEGAHADVRQQGAMRDIFRHCSNAFLHNYVQLRCHGMAHQCLGEDGKPTATIPATPDADPGYHTNLSMIDALELLETLRAHRGS